MIFYKKYIKQGKDCLFMVNQFAGSTEPTFGIDLVEIDFIFGEGEAD